MKALLIGMGAVIAILAVVGCAAFKGNPAKDHYEQGRYLMSGWPGKHIRAIEEFDEAIRLKPDYAEAYFGRGKALFSYIDVVGRNKPQYYLAIQNFDKAIHYGQHLPTKRTYGSFQDPDIGRVYWYRGRAYHQLAENALGAIGLTNRAERKASWQPKAKADYAKACSLDPSYLDYPYGKRW